MTSRSLIHSPPSPRRSITEKSTMAKEMDIAEMQRQLQQQERLIHQLQEQQQQQLERSQGTFTGSSDAGNFGNPNTWNNFGYFSIRDALEAVPSFDGDNIAFTHFVEGCEEALTMISPSQEIILTRAIRNKLKGDAHKSILGKVFNSLRELVEFLRNKYGTRETVYEAQARLAYICQKDNEKVSIYANRIREIGKRIIDAQKRQSSVISEDLKKSLEEHLKICFLRGLNSEIRIIKEGTFDELESRAIDAERELETVKMIRQVVLGDKGSDSNKRTHNTSTCRVGSQPVKCQYCHKIGHTADRCRFINNNRSIQPNFYPNNQNRNNTQVPPPPPGSSTQNPNNISPIVCRYCWKPGHMLKDCRKRLYYSQVRQNQVQGNGQIPAMTGATPGNVHTRPARAIAMDSDINTEE